MFLLEAQLTVLGIAIFIVAFIAFVFALRFFLQSRKNVDQFLSGQKRSIKKFDEFYENVFLFKRRTPRAYKSAQDSFSQASASTEDVGTNEIRNLRSMILKQQSQLSKALSQINGLENGRQERGEDTGSVKRIKELEITLDKKDSEIKSLRQQAEVSKEMQVHFNQLEKEFDVLQQKLEKLEQQAWEANELTIKLDNVTQSYQHLQQEFIKKENKLQEVSKENQRLHSVLSETEDKLQESNLQRQQMTKKMQFLEEMNSDMKQVAETNRRLQNELRRIAELESMLNLITEERDELLKIKIR